MGSTARDSKFVNEADGIDEYQGFSLFRGRFTDSDLRRRCATNQSPFPHTPVGNEAGLPILFFSIEDLIAY